jgi:hypothetical protein
MATVLNNNSWCVATASQNSWKVFLINMEPFSGNTLKCLFDEITVSWRNYFKYKVNRLLLLAYRTEIVFKYFEIEHCIHSIQLLYTLEANLV